MAVNGVDATLSYMKSLGQDAWSEIKQMAGNIKDIAGSYMYLAELQLSSQNAYLPFGQSIFLNLLNGNNNTFDNILNIGQSAFDFANNLYDIADAMVTNTIDYSSEMKSLISSSVWWQETKDGIINTAIDVKNGFSKISTEAINVILSKEYMQAMAYMSEFMVYGQAAVISDLIKSGQPIGQDIASKVVQYLNAADPKVEIYRSETSNARTVDMTLNVFGFNWDEYIYELASAGIYGPYSQVGQDVVMWEKTVVEGAEKIKTALQEIDSGVVWASGINVQEVDAGYAEAFLQQLGASIEGKKVVIAHSAGTDAAIRSMLKQKADKYILISPRMSPTALANLAREAGVDMKDIIVMYADNDFPHWGLSPFDGYYDPGDSGLTTIYIKRDYDKTNSILDIIPGFGGHGVPVEALRYNHRCKMVVNGTEEFEGNLADVIKEYV